MASLRDIRQKIKSVTTTQQITNAMRMMSTAKLSRAVEAVNKAKPYINKLLSLARHIKTVVPNLKHPAFEKREINKTSTIIIGGERGLCGGFNQELHNYVQKRIKKLDISKQKFYVIGQKPIRFLQSLNIPIEKEFETLNINELKPKLIELSNELFEEFKAQKTDRVNIISTSYTSSVNRPIVTIQLLPLPENSDLFSETEKAADTEEKGQSITSQDFDFFPSPKEIFDNILPRYMYNSLLKAVLESVAAEQCSRMIAMTSATDRANEKLESLRLELNRSRQAQITQEINEVVAGSQT